MSVMSPIHTYTLIKESVCTHYLCCFQIYRQKTDKILKAVICKKKKKIVWEILCKHTEMQKKSTNKDQTIVITKVVYIPTTFTQSVTMDTSLTYSPWFLHI